jgi:hypothetical protein
MNAMSLKESDADTIWAADAIDTHMNSTVIVRGKITNFK